MGKRGWKAVERECQWRRGARTSIAGQALLPIESPMRALCSRHHVLGGQSSRFFRGRHPHRHLHGFASHHLEPVAPDLTAWPIAPQNRKTEDWFGRLWGRLRQARQGGRHATSRDGPENGAHPSWGARWKDFPDTAHAPHSGGNHRCGLHRAREANRRVLACALA